MNTDQLKYFVETARFQHIGRAARALHISPSAISHCIKNLEEELQCKLFQKQGKNIYLTSRGKRLAEKAALLLDLTTKMKQEIQGEGADWEGRFRIGVTHGLVSTLFTPRWNSFQKGRAGLKLELYSHRSAQVVELVSKGELDLGICFSPLAHPQIGVEKIRDQQLVIAMRPGHPLLKGPKGPRLRELSRFPCASPKAFQGIEVCEDHPELKRLGISAPIDFIFDSYDAALARLRGTNSWCLLPEIFASTGKMATVVPPGWNAPSPICALWPKNRLLPKALADLIKDLKVGN